MFIKLCFHPVRVATASAVLKVIIVVTSPKLNMSSSQVSSISSPNGKQHQKQQSRKKGSTDDRNIMITRLISLQVLLLALILHFLVAFVTGNWTGTSQNVIFIWVIQTIKGQLQVKGESFDDENS